MLSTTLSFGPVVALGALAVLLLAALGIALLRIRSLEHESDSEHAMKSLDEAAHAIGDLRRDLDALGADFHTLCEQWLGAPERKGAAKHLEDLAWRVGDGDLSAALKRASQTWHDLRHLQHSPEDIGVTRTETYMLDAGLEGLVISDRRRVPAVTKRQLRCSLICQAAYEACDAAEQRITELRRSADRF